MPINLDIDEVYVYPQPAGENPDYIGIEEELGVKVIAKEGVDTKSYGISGAVAFPDATAKLFTIPDGMERQIRSQRLRFQRQTEHDRLCCL
ncbi:MAG: hypothetical protein ACLTXT_02635 [Ruminococcus callidus]